MPITLGPLVCERNCGRVTADVPTRNDYFIYMSRKYAWFCHVVRSGPRRLRTTDSTENYFPEGHTRESTNGFVGPKLVIGR